jgi:methylthioxylose transferase
MHIESIRERTDLAPRQVIQATWNPVTIALVVWTLLIVIAFVWGSALNRTTGQHLDAPPLFGHFNFQLSLSVILAGVVAVATVRWGSRVALLLRWIPLLAAAWATTLAWTLALNTVTGLHQLAAPLTTGFEYGRAVRFVDTPLHFLATYVARLPTYPVHVEGHPPGMVLLLWFMRQLGLGGVGWEAALAILAGSSSVVAALILCRSIAGESPARRCAPFLILAPMALWVATSADALFLGVSAWSLVIIVVSMERTGWAGRTLALAGGALFGAALMLSYGSLALGLVPLVVGLRRQAVDKLALAAAGALFVLGSFWVAGFSWLAGLQATKTLYASGISTHRPYVFFCLANLAAFAIVVGPAGVAGLASLRNRSLWLIVGATVMALLIADLSGYSKGEVERIWLPFAPWILIATSDLPSLPFSMLLGLQAAAGIAVAMGVRTAW